MRALTGALSSLCTAVCLPAARRLASCELFVCVPQAQTNRPCAAEPHCNQVDSSFPTSSPFAPHKENYMSRGWPAKVCVFLPCFPADQAPSPVAVPIPAVSGSRIAPAKKHPRPPSAQLHSQPHPKPPRIFFSRCANSRSLSSLGPPVSDHSTPLLLKAFLPIIGSARPLLARAIYSSTPAFFFFPWLDSCRVTTELYSISNFAVELQRSRPLLISRGAYTYTLCFTNTQ